MTALDQARAYVVRNSSFTIAGTHFENACTKARLVPDTPILTQRTLIPTGTVQDVDTTTWQLEITGFADYFTDGLGGVLLAHNGETVACVLTPRLLGPVATFSVVAIPMDFGGDQGSWNTADITMGVIGQPVFSVQTES